MRLLYQLSYMSGLLGAILSLRNGSETWFKICLAISGWFIIMWAFESFKERRQMAKTGNVCITITMNPDDVPQFINLSNVCRIWYQEDRHRLNFCYNNPDEVTTLDNIDPDTACKLMIKFRDLANGITKEFDD